MGQPQLAPLNLRHHSEWTVIRWHHLVSETWRSPSGQEDIVVNFESSHIQNQEARLILLGKVTTTATVR
jgi:hypothetical protein